MVSEAYPEISWGDGVVGGLLFGQIFQKPARANNEHQFTYFSSSFSIAWNMEIQSNILFGITLLLWK